MVNFGERLAYWYLRLNGFLLVEDFVLHREPDARTSDADLLAVRLRHSNEQIDGAPLALHDAIRTLVGAGPDEKHVALVVQVKTGEPASAGEAFNDNRLRRGLRFIGALPEEALARVVTELELGATSLHDGWVFAKLLIAENLRDDGNAVGVPLNDALKFIQSRLQTHRVRKAADRLFFPDELMQYLAWRAGQEDRSRG
ncbi:MAG: hypothetical protein JNL68_13785 [Burkholderiales bacterium]|nr:hypothetical protein [Burkholderiales bacterium]